MSFILIIVTSSDGETVTAYDIGPHTGSPLQGVHDNVISHISPSLTVKSLMREGGPRNEQCCYVVMYDVIIRTLKQLKN